jgi:hypothetical protein
MLLAAVRVWGGAWVVAVDWDGSCGSSGPPVYLP